MAQPACLLVSCICLFVSASLGSLLITNTSTSPAYSAASSSHSHLLSSSATQPIDEANCSRTDLTAPGITAYPYKHTITTHPLHILSTNDRHNTTLHESTAFLTTTLPQHGFHFLRKGVWPPTTTTLPLATRGSSLRQLLSGCEPFTNPDDVAADKIATY